MRTWRTRPTTLWCRSISFGLKKQKTTTKNLTFSFCFRKKIKRPQMLRFSRIRFQLGNSSKKSSRLPSEITPCAGLSEKFGEFLEPLNIVQTLLHYAVTNRLLHLSGVAKVGKTMLTYRAIKYFKDKTVGSNGLPVVPPGWNVVRCDNGAEIEKALDGTTQTIIVVDEAHVNFANDRFESEIKDPKTFHSIVCVTTTASPGEFKWMRSPKELDPHRWWLNHPTAKSPNGWNGA